MRLLDKKPASTIGLIGHTIISYPSQSEAEQIVEILVNNNVDLIELQIPFSEPVADGPLFTKANHDAILSGVTLRDCYDFMAAMSATYSIPFVFMTYANIVYKQGFANFVKTAKSVGAKGAVIPDLPLDIAKEYLKVCRDEDFTAIPIVAPNISHQRLKTIAPYFDGFIYAVARAGVTGERTTFDASLIEYFTKLQTFSDLPIAAGFGISNKDDLNFLRGKTDYAIIGTQTLRAYQQKGLEGVRELWQELNRNRGC